VDTKNNIVLTASNGKSYVLKDFGKNGEHITITYTNKNGEKLTYMIRVTPKLRLVMN
jgi:hypothetical protein